MRICDAAVEILRETGNQSVMWGDLGLLHDIAERAGWSHESFRTPPRVLAALSKTPGPLMKSRVFCARWVLKFSLPSDATPKPEESPR